MDEKIEFRDLRDVLINKIRETNTFSEIYTICDLGKELAYQGGLNG